MLPKKLCILLPTNGREECVSYYLTHSLDACREWGIDLYLCDSSQTDANRLLVEDHVRRGYDNVFFMPQHPRHAPSAPGYRVFPNPDHKVFCAQLELAQRYDYIWLCGDNCLIDFDAALPQVKRCMEQGADILHFEDHPRMALGQEQVYTDAKKFYVNDAWHMTAYGVSLVSSRVILGMNTPEALEKYLDSGFLYIMSLMDYCAKNSFTAVHCHQRFFRDNPYRAASGWIANGTALEVFARNWTLANRALNSLYDGQKEAAIRAHGVHTGLFSLFGCLRLRATENITLAKLKQVKQYLPGLSDTPVWWYYAAAVCPRSLAKLACKLRERR